MTAKQKAQELYETFIPVTRQYKTKKPIFSERLMAKNCALVCVDAIISSWILKDNQFNQFAAAQIQYFHQVKRELIDLLINSER